jgi:hypothetical protein
MAQIVEAQVRAARQRVSFAPYILDMIDTDREQAAVNRRRQLGKESARSSASVRARS